MKNIQIIAWVLGASLVTFVLSVIFSINMVKISPQNLAKIIKEDPETFIEAIKEASEGHQKQAAEKALTDLLKNPATIPTDGRVTFGNTSAPVTIVEYSDFQCGFCWKASRAMKQLREKYDGQVNLVYKHFPLDFHGFAKPAAEYFEAIALIDHEKARQFHDAIFDNFSDYAKLQKKQEINKSLKAIVKKMDLDMKTVENNMEKAQEVVQQDIDEAKKLDVRGTPSFFVNGVSTQHKGRNFPIELIVEKVLKTKK